MSGIRFGTRSAGLLMLLILASGVIAACSGSSEEESTDITPVASEAPTVGAVSIEDTPVVKKSTPTAKPVLPTATTTAKSTATATTPDPVPTVVLEKIAVDLAIPMRCELNSGTSGFGGTAPGPTPTPIPENGGTAGLLELNINAALGIADHIEASSIAFEDGWELASEGEEQAALLMELNGRLSLLCSATRFLEGASGLDLQIASALSEAIRTRYVWTVLALDELTCCENAKDSSLGVGRRLTHENMIRVVDNVRQQLSSSATNNDVLYLDRLGLRLGIPAGWVMTGGESRPVLIAPSSDFLPGFNGLGPSNWQSGISMRFRRFRVDSEISLSEATDSFKNLALNFGSVIEKTNAEFLGSPATKWVVSSSDSNWNMEILLTVANGYAYVLDLGCPPANPESCSVMRDIGFGAELVE